MGQTLTHGIYLPDEGERNCYSGLASNWSILDGAVGTIAEHTTQIAGKAPAVHTHVKSDVTDLLNSNFIPSANNSYDLGSSSYQWNNVYSKNYYYNGVAWGLDKENTWSATQWLHGSNLVCKNALKEIGSANSGGHFTLNFFDKNNHMMGWVQHLTEFTRIGCKNKFTSGVLDPNGTEIQNYLSVYVKSNGKTSVGFVSDALPEINGKYELGNSSYKWKSLNGINPGALSLPDYDSTAKLNLTSTFPAPDSNGNILYTPTMSGWLYICFNISSATTIVASDSIFYIQAKDNNVVNANFVQTSWMLKSGGTNSLAIFFPVVANKQFVIQINFTGYTLTKVFLIPGLGHVA